MQDSTFWWIGAGFLLVLEMGTSTIYLLMLALGAVAAAVVAHLGGSINNQIVAATLVGLACSLGWYLWRKRSSVSIAADGTNPEQGLDIGQFVDIEDWSAQGSARVRYRGAMWLAVLRAGQTGEAGRFRIVEIAGNSLIVEKA